MQTDINQITQQYFQKDNLDAVSAGELEGFISKHPYSASARYLLAQKLYNDSEQGSNEQLVTASLYFHNPLWLDWLLKNHVTEEQASPLVEHSAEEPVRPRVENESQNEPLPTAETVAESPIVFQSYHTIDYFASQGIRLDSADLTRDRLGQQLKSFTEWLKSMKKLPKSEIERPRQFDEAGQQQVISNAAHSIEEKDIITEAMAEVWAKQGNAAKAIDIYNKLSLQDPAKSAYFAAKIDQLK